MKTKFGNQKGFLPLVPAVIIGIVVLGGGAVVAAQNSVPGDKLYGLKNATERIRIIMSFTHSEKAKVHLAITLEKLEELQKLQSERADANEISEAAKSLKDHQDDAIEEFKLSADQGLNTTEIIQQLKENSEQQQNVLSDLLTKVPTAAKESIKSAAQSSSTGLQKAQEAQSKRP